MGKINIDNFITLLEELIIGGVSEIIKNGSTNYTFLKDGIWYNIKYEFDFGYYIVLRKGDNISGILEIVYITEKLLGTHSPKRNKGNKLFRDIETLYMKHKIFNCDKVVSSFKNYSTLIESCSAIYKATNNIFILYIGETKYSFERNEKYVHTDNSIKTTLVVTKFTNEDSEVIYNKSDYNKAENIFAVLNTIYYLNETSKELDVRKDFCKILNLE